MGARGRTHSVRVCRRHSDQPAQTGGRCRAKRTAAVVQDRDRTALASHISLLKLDCLAFECRMAAPDQRMRVHQQLLRLGGWIMIAGRRAMVQHRIDGFLVACRQVLWCCGQPRRNLPRHASDCWFSRPKSVLPAMICSQSSTASAVCAWLRCRYAGRAM